MSQKKHTFSVYLLKENVVYDTAFSDDCKLIEVAATNLPPESKLYLADSIPKVPWWKEYFAIEQEVKQVQKGAILLLTVNGRKFALCFGHVAHNLEDSAIVYDFGFRVALNSLDPQEIHSADKSEPYAAKQTRTQSANPSDLTFLDFDTNSEILKSLTGKVRDEHKEDFDSVTGASNLRVSMKVEAKQLSNKFQKLLNLYDRDDYLEHFPSVRNVVPESDPGVVGQLDTSLLEAVGNRSNDLKLLVPDIVDYRAISFCAFSANGYESDTRYADITIESFFDFLGEEPALRASIEDLKKWKLQLLDDSGFTTSAHSMYRSLVYETNLPDVDDVFHFHAGKWYRIKADFVARLHADLEPYWVENFLPPYNHDARAADGKIKYSEESYNAAIGQDGKSVTLDQTNISPHGQTQVEPCDILRVSQDAERKFDFIHVKISTRSASLSHLMGQALVPIKLLLEGAEAKHNLKALVDERIAQQPRHPLSGSEFGIRTEWRVIIAVVTHLESERKAANFPLFTKITLRSRLRELRVMLGIECRYMFIPDQSPKKASNSRYEQTSVVYLGENNGQHDYRLLDGQFANLEISRKRKISGTKDLALGSEFSATVKKLPNDKYSVKATDDENDDEAEEAA